MMKILHIDGREYIIELTDKKSLNFSRTEFDEWGEEQDHTGLTDDTKNPVKVLRRIFDEVLDFVAENRITYLTFASYNPKRTRIYQKMINKLVRERNLPYVVLVNNGDFVLYKVFASYNRPSE